jgi:hypothetical protein
VVQVARRAVAGLEELDLGFTEGGVRDLVRSLALLYGAEGESQVLLNHFVLDAEFRTDLPSSALALARKTMRELEESKVGNTLDKISLVSLLYLLSHLLKLLAVRHLQGVLKHATCCKRKAPTRAHQ